MQAFMNALSPGYFETMRIPLLEGRDFNRDSDDHGSPTAAEAVAIVNRKFAEHFFPGQSAVGKRIGQRHWPAKPSSTSRSSASSPTRSMKGRATASTARSSSRTGARTASIFYLRTPTASATAYGTDPQPGAEARRRSMPVYAIKTVEAQLDETLMTDRLIAMLAAGFGLLATLLASIGLYGVMAFVVARRRKELGIRLALGAEPGVVIWLVMNEVLLLLAIGLAVGIPAALALGRYVASQLYGIEARDPAIATATVVLLTLVSAAAGLIPAHRASRIDPILALRYE